MRAKYIVTVIFYFGFAVTSRAQYTYDSTEVKNVAVDSLVEELPEVLLFKNKKINAVALGIIPHEVEKITINEKRLRTASKFEPVYNIFMPGVRLPLTPILNAINGRTKKLKKIVAVERNYLNVQFFKENYIAYILENFQVTETDFERFLYFMADDPVCYTVIETENKNRIELFICAQWVAFNAEK